MTRASGRPSRAWASAFVVCWALACATPVGLVRQDAQSLHRALTANVLSAGRPSAHASQQLDRRDLSDLFRREPAVALAHLHSEAVAGGSTDLLAALAELSFLHAERGGRPWYLAAALYAYAFLAESSLEASLNALDPRFRLAADLYNLGLSAGLRSDDGEEVLLTPGIRPLPFGSLDLAVDEAEFLWGGYRMVRFVPVAEFEVRGLRNRYRKSGLGAPLAASLAPTDAGDPPPGHEFIPKSTRVPATVVLQVPEVIRALREGHVSGRLWLFTRDETVETEVGGRRVPLEAEPTAALAAGLAESSFWVLERQGFLSGDFGREGYSGLTMFQPYHPGRVPVVFVHGTASSSARWANMINELSVAPEIHENFQFWFFQYNTGSPVVYSAGLLREALDEAVRDLDPEGRDPALRHMVVIGHSQGGLLTKLTVVDSGTVFWDQLILVPIEEFELEPETRAIAERSLFFEPLPFVRRVIFIATPHRGSFVAERWRVRIASSLVSLPGELLEASVALLDWDDDRVLLRSLDDLPSSIDNMTSDNRFLVSLAGMPIAEGVTAHSIIAVQGDGPPEEGNDGVVAFESARLDGVASEYVVRSGHSAQSHPLTIREVRRILQEHISAYQAGSQDGRASRAQLQKPAIR